MSDRFLSLYNKIKSSYEKLDKSVYFKVNGVGGEILNVLACVNVSFNIGTSTFSHVFHVFQR